MTDAPAVLSLAAGTLALRPYVLAFLLAFLVAAARDLGPVRAAGFLGWGFLVAFASEFASTRIGVPFGLYHYTGSTRGLELFVSNVPFFDSLSFPFLAYAAFCLARRVLGEGRPVAIAGLGGALMTLLDVVIDPLAVRGDRWFLGRIFYYPEGGAYFGVPLSNFGGWLAVGVLIIGGYLAAAGGARRGSPALGVALYVAILAFNLALTAWIGAWGLLGVGILVHTAAFLILYGISATRTAWPPGHPRARRVSAGGARPRMP